MEMAKKPSPHQDRWCLLPVMNLVQPQNAHKSSSVKNKVAFWVIWKLAGTLAPLACDDAIPPSGRKLSHVVCSVGAVGKDEKLANPFGLTWWLPAHPPPPNPLSPPLPQVCLLDTAPFPTASCSFPSTASIPLELADLKHTQQGTLQDSINNATILVYCVTT